MGLIEENKSILLPEGFKWLDCADGSGSLCDPLGKRLFSYDKNERTYDGGISYTVKNGGSNSFTGGLEEFKVYAESVVMTLAKKLSYENMERESTDLGFEFKGQWITNPFLDVSGRFEIKNLNEMYSYYGKDNVDNFLLKIPIAFKEKDSGEIKNETCISLKVLYDSGHQCLVYGGEIRHIVEDDNDFYDLVLNGPEHKILLCDGEEVKVLQKMAGRVLVEGEDGCKILFTPEEFAMATFGLEE